MSILVMWLLTWCYQQGLGSFTATKAQGDLMDSQRQVTSVMTRDLTASHFLPDDTKANSGLRVSDQGFVGGTGYVVPSGGYFRATTAPGTNEGADGDGFSSWLSTAYTLQFTSILPGGPPQSVFSAELTTPATTYFGRAAEIAYFLSPAPGSTPNGTPLYNLIRRQRLCAMTSDDASSYSLTGASADTTEVVAASGSPLAISTLGQLTLVPAAPSAKNPSYRLFPPPPAPNSQPTQLGLDSVNSGNSVRFGEDILMSNVLSFEVKFTGPTTTINNATWPTAFMDKNNNVTNSDYPYDNLPRRRPPQRAACSTPAIPRGRLRPNRRLSA